MDNNEFPGWHGDDCRCKEERQSCHCGGWSSRLGQTVIKGSARKVRKLSPGGHDVIAGLRVHCGCIHVLERLEAKLEASPGQLARASVELAKDWRTDKYLQKLEAMLIVTDGDLLLIITGAGDVLEQA